MGAQKKDKPIKFIIDNLNLYCYKERVSAKAQSQAERRATSAGWRWAPSYEMLVNNGEQQDGIENEKSMDGAHR